MMNKPRKGKDDSGGPVRIQLYIAFLFFIFAGSLAVTHILLGIYRF